MSFKLCKLFGNCCLDNQCEKQEEEYEEVLVTYKIIDAYIEDNSFYSCNDAIYCKKEHYTILENVETGERKIVRGKYGDVKDEVFKLKETVKKKENKSCKAQIKP